MNGLCGLLLVNWIDVLVNLNAIPVPNIAYRIEAEI